MNGGEELRGKERIEENVAERRKRVNGRVERVEQKGSERENG